MATHTDLKTGEKSAQSNAAEGELAVRNSARKTAGVEVRDGDTIAEVELARGAGVTREDLKKMRAALVEGEDWSGGGGRAVMIHPSGRRKLEAMLAQRVLDGVWRSEGEDGAVGKNAALAGAVTLGRPAYVTLVVHERTLAVRNKRLVLAVVKRMPAEAPEILPLQESEEAAEQSGNAGSGDVPRLLQPTPPAPKLNPQPQGGGAEELVRVDVKNAALFKPGMTLERCLASRAFPGFYHYHGRMPRRRGKF